MPESLIATAPDNGSHVTDFLFALREPTVPGGHPLPASTLVSPTPSRTHTSDGALQIGIFAPFMRGFSSELEVLSAEALFVESVESDLESNAAAIISEETRRAILDIAAALSHQVYSVPAVRHAAFVDEEGGASLVIHSRQLKRQLSFESTNSGKTRAIRIDEELRRREYALEPTDTKLVLELISWMRKPS